MATSKTFNNQLTGFIAGADLSAAQYKAVKLASTAGEVVLATAADKAALSILQNDPAEGQPALLPGPGDTCKAIAGAADIAIGDWLVANSTSQLTDVTTGFVVAIALEASSAVGNYISVMIQPHEQA
jgi:hypothetical protein